VGSILAFASHLYVDLDGLALPSNCVVSTLGALALISHLVGRPVSLNHKPLPVAASPAEVMVGHKGARALESTSPAPRIRHSAPIVLCKRRLPPTFLPCLIGTQPMLLPRR
jgi:hypothetical protein